MPPRESCQEMSEITLQDLDRRSVAVALTIQERVTVLTGMGSYQAQSEFGPCLRIACRDEAGDFEIVLREDQWCATILPGSSSGDADFTIVLGPPSPD